MVAGAERLRTANTIVVQESPALHGGHELPRLRGVMVSPEIDEAGLRVLGQEWNANLIRWQLIRRGRIDNPLDLAAYEKWLQSAIQQLDRALPLCEKYGLRVVVDLHSPPGGHTTSGGYAGSDYGLFTDAACQRKFVEVWQADGAEVQGREGHLGIRSGQRAGRARCGRSAGRLAGFGPARRPSDSRDRPPANPHCRAGAVGGPGGIQAASAAYGVQRGLQRPHVHTH